MLKAFLDWLISGGICLAFPVYGEWRFGSRHGFTRNMPWKLIDGPTYLETGDVYVVCGIQDNAYTNAYWNRRFGIRYKIILKEMQLCFEITVSNMDKNESLEFSVLQHTYVRVPDVTQCKIIGKSQFLLSYLNYNFFRASKTNNYRHNKPWISPKREWQLSARP